MLTRMPLWASYVHMQKERAYSTSSNVQNKRTAYRDGIHWSIESRCKRIPATDILALFHIIWETFLNYSQQKHATTFDWLPIVSCKFTAIDIDGQGDKMQISSKCIKLASDKCLMLNQMNNISCWCCRIILVIWIVIGNTEQVSPTRI